jgi:hypothetical protein
MMNTLRLPLIALLSLAALTATMPLATGAAATGKPPHDLRCEYLTDPLGIDLVKPRFSWKQTDPEHVRG